MAKVEYRNLPRRERQELEQELFGIIGRFGLTAEGRLFLHDLLTESEIIMLARRIRIARELLAGRSFQGVARKLHVGLATVQAVDRWLQKRFEGYRSILGSALVKMESESPGRRNRRRWHRPLPSDPTSVRGLRARYPGHFLLLNLLLGDPQAGYEWKA